MARKRNSRKRNKASKRQPQSNIPKAPPTKDIKSKTIFHNEAAQAERDTAQAERDAALAKVQEVEAENARLRALLMERGIAQEQLSL